MLTINFILFFSIFLLVFLFQVYIIKKRFIDKISIHNSTKKIVTILLYLTFFGVILYPLMRHNPTLPSWFFWITTLPIGIIFITFCVTLIYDLCLVAIQKIPFVENRRDFFRKGLDIGAIALLVTTNAKALHNGTVIEVESVDVKIDTLTQPYKMIQISDLHIGEIIDTTFVRRVVTTINQLQPDLVVITGDLIDTKLEFARESLDELRLLRSKFGTFFVVGNHEYFHGIGEIIEYMDLLGIKTLENENIYIGEKENGFYLCGVYDLFGRRYGSFAPDLSLAMKNTHGEPKILLAHQPRFINEITDDEAIDLILCGHTHGGQIFPFNLLVRLQQPYLEGLYRHNEKTQVYVNKGTGFWGPPMRLGTSSEITLLQLSP